MKSNRFLAVFACVLLIGGFGFAATADTTVTFKIPADIAFSVAYPASCSSADFAFYESDGTLDGSQTHINVTQTDGSACQTAAAPAINVTNDGNTAIDITAAFTASLPAGITVKASQAATGYESSCTGTEPPASVCVELSDSSKLLADGIAAGASQEIWVWADMSSFNSGAAGEDTRTLRLTSAADS